jgi:gas vesicle protein
MSSGKVLLGLLAGVAAGAMLGVLFAPDKGWVTRKRIAKKSEDYVDVLTDKFNEFLDTVTGKIEDVEAEAENVKTKAESFKSAAKAATS